MKKSTSKFKAAVGKASGKSKLIPYKSRGAYSHLTFKSKSGNTGPKSRPVAGRQQQGFAIPYKDRGDYSHLTFKSPSGNSGPKAMPVVGSPVPHGSFKDLGIKHPQIS